MDPRMRRRWFGGPCVIVLGLAVLTVVGCAPVLELEGGLPRVIVEPPLEVGCLYRVGVEPMCWGCRYTVWADDLYCDRVFIGSTLEWRL